MSRYSLNSIVSHNEQEALKEMIFKRARERAQAINDDVQKTCTENIQFDVMNIARDSFKAPRNPFGKIEEKTEKIEKKPIDNKKDVEIGFAQRNIEEIKAQIKYRNKDFNNNATEKEVNQIMSDARKDFSNKQSFTGALEFLNSQASIALIQNKNQKFEAIA